MRCRGRTLVVIAASALLLGANPRTGIHAQTAVPDRPPRALLLSGGGWFGDVDAVVGAVRAEFPLGRSGRWVFAPTLTYSHYHLQPVPQLDVIIPEAQVQLRLARGGRVHPYLAGGVGVAFINVVHTFDPVVTLGAGARVDLSPQWGAVIEGEARSLAKYGAVGWRLGIARQF
jgi:hypothetical protein